MKENMKGTDMKKTLALILALLATPAFANDEIPVGCIDYEYYNDLDYYGSFQVIAYGKGGVENRGAEGTSELIQDVNGEQFVSIFTSESVCIDTLENMQK